MLVVRPFTKRCRSVNGTFVQVRYISWLDPVTYMSYCTVGSSNFLFHPSSFLLICVHFDRFSEDEIKNV